MSYQTLGATTIANGVTTVDCQKQVRSWRLLRSLMEFLIPSCHRTSFEEQELKEESYFSKKNCPKRCYTISSTILTCTIFRYRKGKMHFCIQRNSTDSTPLLLLDLEVPATTLAREMQGGILRIALQSTKQEDGHADSCSLLSTPLWTMYCNGRKVGYAVKRRASKADIGALEIMSAVDVGAGIINGNELDREDELMYLRAKFESLCGSTDSQSFHLVDPDGNIGQELSIFFFRSR